MDTPRGARSFDVIDPFGNTLFVVGPAGGDEIDMMANQDATLNNRNV